MRWRRGPQLRRQTMPTRAGGAAATTAPVLPGDDALAAGRGDGRERRAAAGLPRRRQHHHVARDGAGVVAGRAAGQRDGRACASSRTSSSTWTCPARSPWATRSPCRWASSTTCPKRRPCAWKCSRSDWFELLDEPVKEIEIAANDITVVYFRIRALDFGSQPFQVTAYGSTMSDAIRKDVRVFPDGKQTALLGFRQAGRDGSRSRRACRSRRTPSPGRRR